MKIRSWRLFSYFLVEGGVLLTKRTTTLGDHYSSFVPRRILKCNYSYFSVRYIYFSWPSADT